MSSSHWRRVLALAGSILTATSNFALAGGSVIAWGDPTAGGDFSSVEKNLRSGVFSVQTTDKAMAALKEDGSVVVWGDPKKGGDPGAAAPLLTSGVVRLFSGPSAFAALKSNGAVVSWGDSSIADTSKTGTSLSTGVTEIVANDYAFAAIKSDGSVVTWGGGYYGGDSSSVASRLAGGVMKIVASELGFAALKSDGSVVYWGDGYNTVPSAKLLAALASGVTAIASNAQEFAAVKTNGSVIRWGKGWEADLSLVSDLNTKLSSGVMNVVSAPEAMTAFKANGETVCWADFSSIQLSPVIAGPIVKIVTFKTRFTALLADGSAISWGKRPYNYVPAVESPQTGIADISAHRWGFYALKTDGTSVEWDWDAPSPLGQVKSIVVNSGARCVLNADGTLAPSGSPADGGSTYGVSRELAPVVVKELFITETAMAAVTETPRVFVDPLDFTENLAPSAVDHALTVPQGKAGEYFTFSLTSGDDDDGNALFSVARNTLAPLAPLDHESTPAIRVRIRATGSLGTVAENALFLRVLNDPADDAPIATYGVVAFGSKYGGGDATLIAQGLRSGVKSVITTANAFAAVKKDGSVLVWGNREYGGRQADVPRDLSLGSGKLLGSWREFITLSSFGSVRSWGASTTPFSSYSRLYATDLTHGIVDVVDNGLSFAALREDGKIAVWSSTSQGATVLDDPALASGYKQVLPAVGGFIILTHAGNVFHSDSTSSYSPNDNPALRDGVVSIEPMGAGFAATKTDGSKVFWGTNRAYFINAIPATRVVKVVEGSLLGAVLLTDGSVQTLGYSGQISGLDSGVVDLQNSGDAFAAIKTDGSVVVWGDPERGGDAGGADLSSGVAKVIPGYSCFAALKQNGSVVTWGHAANGGDSSSMRSELAGGVILVKKVPGPGFVALKSNGRLAIWGTAAQWVDFAALEKDVQGRAVDVFATGNGATGFAALVPEPPPSFEWSMGSLTGNSPAGALAGRLVPPADDSGKTYVFSLIAGLGDRDNALFRISGNDLLTRKSINHESVPLAQVRVRMQSSDGTILEKAVLVRVDDATPASARSGHQVVLLRGPFADSLPADVAGALSSKVIDVIPAQGSFAALRQDGSVIGYGPYATTSNIAGLKQGVRKVFAANGSWAWAALKNDGSVIGWGDNLTAGSLGAAAKDLQGGVVDIFPGEDAFAALKFGGSVVTWGFSLGKGDSSQVSHLLQGSVVKVFSNHGAFAALRWDGSVVTWGGLSDGGDSFEVAWKLSEGVTDIVATQSSFAALKNDGSVVTWGNSDGGNSSGVSDKLAYGVEKIFSNRHAFAALKTNGSVVAWGEFDNGGDTTAVAYKLTSGVVDICSNHYSFAALRSDGSAVSWGVPEWGGYQGTAAAALASGVVEISANDASFAARKTDGSVVTWGFSDGAGYPSAVAGALATGVVKVVGSGGNFAGIRTGGRVVAWTPNITFDGPPLEVPSLGNVKNLIPLHAGFAALIPDAIPRLSPGSIKVAENRPANTVIARLSVTGKQPGETLTFTITPGQGTRVNRFFKISGNRLSLRRPLDFERFSHVGIRISASGNKGTSIHSVIAVKITDRPEKKSAVPDPSARSISPRVLPNADSDGDGVANLIELAVGRNPNTSGTEEPPLRIANGENGCRVEFFRSQADTNRPFVQYSVDGLSAWTTAIDGIDGVAIQTLPDAFPGLDRIVVWIPVPQSGRIFARLAVE